MRINKIHFMKGVHASLMISSHVHRPFTKQYCVHLCVHTYMFTCMHVRVCLFLGKYQSRNNSANCLSCEPGYFTNNTGMYMYMYYYYYYYYYYYSIQNYYSLTHTHSLPNQHSFMIINTNITY